MDSRRIGFIVNPSAGAGRGGNILPDLRRILEKRLSRDDWKIYITTHSGHGVELTLQAIEDGYNWIISVGGDGTHNEVLNGIMTHQNLRQDDGIKIVMGLVPVGTGGDFQRTLATKGFSTSQHLGMILNPEKYSARPQLIDVGMVECTSLDTSGSDDESETTTKKRYFINISSCGISAAVCHGANTGSKALGGFATFMYQTCKQTLLWSNKQLRWRVDDEEQWQTGDVYQLVVANGQFFGGGMQVAPLAKIDDGKFDLMAFCNIGVLDIDILRQVYTGTHGKNRKVTRWQTQKVFAELNDESGPDVLIESDGEIAGKLPATWTILPSRLWFVFPEAVEKQ